MNTQEDMVVLIDGVRYRLIKPESHDELEQAIQNNHHYLFGLDSFYFNVKTKIQSGAGIVSIPDAYVIFFDPNPKWCVLEVELASPQICDHLIPQLTKFNRGIDNPSSRKKLIEKLYEAINADEFLKARLKQRVGSGEIHKFVSDLISKNPLMVVAIDEQTDELDEALRDIRGNPKVLEFKTFRREKESGDFVSDHINAYVFNPIFTGKRTQPIAQRASVKEKAQEDKKKGVPTYQWRSSDLKTGQEIYDNGKSNGNLWAGRQGGIEKFIEDVKSSEWRTRKYWTNPSTPPASSRKQNWIPSKEFAVLADTYGGN